MSTATVTTDIHIGPFKIPSNGQNMIMNNYAERNNIIVEIIIPEPMKSETLVTTQWIHSKEKLSRIVMCSIHQLPIKKNRIDEFVSDLADVEFHFALEGISGKGEKFLLDCIHEAKMFNETEKIDSKATTWSDLFEKMQDSIDKE